MKVEAKTWGSVIYLTSNNEVSEPDMKPDFGGGGAGGWRWRMLKRNKISFWLQDEFDKKKLFKNN